MFDWVVPAGFQDMVEPDKVAFNVDVRVIDRVTNACLRSQVDNDGRTVGFKDMIDECLIRDRTLDKQVLCFTGFSDLLDLGKAILLQGRIVVIVHVIETDNKARAYFFKKAHDKICADKSG